MINVQLKIFFIVIITLVMISSGPLFCADKKKNISNPWNLNLSLSSFYDNNILKNSDIYLEKFENNVDNGRFHINRSDDIILEYDLKLSFTNDFIKNRRSILSASVGHNSYSYNSVKTWSTFSLGLQQYIAKPTSIMISYSYLPEFYVKHYRDNDWVDRLGFTPETFKPFSFSKNDLSIWLQHNFLPDTKARVYFSYMRYFHNEHFTEYDCDNFLYGLRLFQSLSKNILIDGGYRYITSDAKGFDQKGEQKISSDDGDASNNEHIIFAGVEILLPPIHKLYNSLSVNGQYSSRKYTTPASHISDRYHAGRVDAFYSIDFTYSVAILRNISLSAYYKMITRDSDTSIEANKSFLSDEKDYNQYLIGLSFSYKIAF